jgi:aryl-alcohol dehydrogenase-like predicted oxidoreductase
MKKIVESGVEIVSNQVSYSVIDTRPMKHMTAFCQQHNIKLLAYGSVLGGFLSDKHVTKKFSQRLRQIIIKGFSFLGS